MSHVRAVVRGAGRWMEGENGGMRAKTNTGKAGSNRRAWWLQRGRGRTPAWPPSLGVSQKLR